MGLNGAWTFLRDRWVPFLLTAALSGGTGGLVAWMTVPSRLDAMETRQTNQYSYFIGELQKLGTQVAHATCLGEAALDTVPGLSESLSRVERRRMCEEIDRRVQDILEERARGR